MEGSDGNGRLFAFVLMDTRRDGLEESHSTEARVGARIPTFFYVCFWTIFMPLLYSFSV